MKKTLRGLSGGPKTALPRGTANRVAPRPALSPAIASPTTPYSKRRRYDFHQVPTELPQLGNPTPERSDTTDRHTSGDRASTGIPGLSQPYVEDVPDEDDEDGVYEQAQREQESKEQVGDGKQGQSNAHKPSYIMKDFKENHATKAQGHLDNREKPPASLERCPACRRDIKDHSGEVRGSRRYMETLYKCQDCPLSSSMCRDCILRDHRMRPLDRIRRWRVEDQFWDKVTLADYLGHNGECCPEFPRHHKDHTPLLHNARSMGIFHEHGFVEMPVVFCRCLPRRSDAEQLISAGLWPATWHTPSTATTLTALDAFHGLSMQAQVNLHDYVQHLKQMTDGVLTDDVKDRYSQLNHSVREYVFVKTCRRQGVTAGQKLLPKSLCAECPACPKPNVNMRKGWQHRSPDKKHMDAMRTTKDGNYHMSGGGRDTDENDTALSMDAGVFVHQGDCAKILDKASKSKSNDKEQTTCSNFGAMNYGQYNGKISGIVAVLCRHSFVLPGGVIDLHNGERFVYVDFAFTSAMQPYMDLDLIVATYDIMCQYIIRFAIRIDEEFSEDMLAELESITSADFPQIIGGVGKYHLSMHTKTCREKFSMNHLPCACMDDGENCERLWGMVNAMSRRTKEMTAGHRHDVLNDLFYHQNVRRMHSMVEFFMNKLPEAEEHLKDLVEYLATIERTVIKSCEADKTKKTTDDEAGTQAASSSSSPPSTPAHEAGEDDVEDATCAGRELINGWKAAEAEWKKKVVDIRQHADLVSPYEPKEETALSSKQIADHLCEERKAQGDRLGAAMAVLIHDLLDLECERTVMQADIDNFKGNERERSHLAAKITDFIKRAEDARDRYERYLQPCVDQALLDVPTDPLNEHFPLRPPAEPSSATAGSRHAVSRTPADTTFEPAASATGEDTVAQRSQDAAGDIDTSLANSRVSASQPDPDSSAEDVPASSTQTTGKKRKRPSARATAAALVRESMTGQLESMALALPSAYVDQIVQHSAMEAAVKYERMIREGCANDALDDLRLHLTTYATMEDRRKHGSGVRFNTPMDKRMQKKKVAIAAAKARYRQTRATLLVLGMPEDDPKYKPLLDSDCKPFVLVIEEQRLGDSRRKPCWIWSDFSFVMKEDDVDVKEFLVDSFRVHWSRYSALVARWQEHVESLREDMFRTRNSYRIWRDVWQERAEKREQAGQLGAAAYARRQKHRFTRLLRKAESRFPKSIEEAVGIPEEYQ